MSVFTRPASSESHRIVERTLILAMKVDGIGVAVPGYVTSQVLLTAGLIRRRAATADAARGDSPRLALGVGTSTLPPVMPAFVQDDGRFRFSAERFIVFRSAPGVDRHS